MCKLPFRVVINNICVCNFAFGYEKLANYIIQSRKGYRKSSYYQAS